MKKTVTNELGEIVVMMDRSDRGPLTEEELDMLGRPDDFADEEDDECPPMTEEMFAQMERDIELKRRIRAARTGQVITRSDAGMTIAVG